MNFMHDELSDGRSIRLFNVIEDFNQEAWAVMTHHLDHALQADQVVVMDLGRIIDSGSHTELIARCALYQQLWLASNQGQSWQLATGNSQPHLRNEHHKARSTQT